MPPLDDGNQLRGGVANIAQVGFVRLLEAAGVKDANDFFENIKKQLGNIAELMLGWKSIIGNLVEGFLGGVKKFCGVKEIKEGCPEFPNRMIEALKTWLKPITRITTIIGGLIDGIINLQFDKIFGLLIQAIGFGWDGIFKMLGKASSAAGININFATVLGVVDILGKGAAKLSDPGALIQQIFEKPQELFGQFKDSIGDFKTLIANVPTLLWNKAKDVLATAALEIAVKAVAKMAAKFGATGAFGLLFTLYGVIKFFIEEGKELIELFDKVKEMFTLAVRGGKEVITSIGDKVNEFITGAIPKLFKLLANVFEVGDLPGAVQKAFDKIQDTAQAPVIKLLTAMFAPIGRFLNKIFGGKMGARRILTPPVPSTAVPGATVWLEEAAPKTVAGGVLQDPAIRVMMRLSNGKEIEVSSDPSLPKLIQLGRTLRTYGREAKKANTLPKASAVDTPKKLKEAGELLAKVKPTGCDLATGPIPGSVSRDGRTYSVTYDAVPNTSSQSGPDVCRVWSIEGPIERTTRNTAEADRATNRYKRYLLSDINDSVAPRNYNPGHVIGATLGGPNDSRNLVPQQSKTNQAGGGYFQMETWIRQCFNTESAPGVKNVKTARMKVVLSYPTKTSAGLANFVPNRFSIEVSFNSQTAHKFVFNQNSVRSDFERQRPKSC